MNIVPGAALVFEGELSWQVLQIDNLPPPTKLAAVNDSNELLLQNVLMSDDKREKLEHDENDVLLLELKKQDLKLRLVLELLGALLVKNDLIPSVKPIRFSSSEISILSASSERYSDENWYEFSIYIDASLPRPLVLYAKAIADADSVDQQLKISSVNPVNKNGFWQGFQLNTLRQSVQDNLEKFIFRYHRKVVAQSRKANSLKES